MVGRLLQRWADTNINLAFEDCQVVPPFSREKNDEIYNKDETDDLDDTGHKDDTDNRDYTDDTYDTELFGKGWNMQKEAGKCCNRLD